MTVNIYDVDTYSIKYFTSNTRIINSIMRANPDYTEGEAVAHIKNIWFKTKSFKKPVPIASNDHAPCTECGSTDFMRTGICFVCATCGTSQGCS